MRNPDSVVSLYTGAGGLDLGLEAAGFETYVAVEQDVDAVATLAKNRAWPVIADNIHDVESKKIAEIAGLKHDGDIGLLVGGPPCQPFSKSGYWASGDARRLGDPRATTLEAYLRVLRDLKPKAFLLENVPGLAYTAKSEGLDLLEKTIASINRASSTNYSFHVGLLNAADFGVPQLRERVFIVGHRDGHAFTFPPATHAASVGDLSPPNALEPYRTAWDAIGDLADDDDPGLRVTGKWSALLPSIPEGQNYLYHTDRGDGLPLFGWRRRYWSFLLKLSKRLPSWTIAAQPGPAIGPFHWKNRRLSMRELCRLQTFPDSYVIAGNHRSIQRQLGNAVASALAERLGLEIRRQFFGASIDTMAPLTLLPPRRGTPPPPARVQPVPKKFRELVGEHSAHPGTGLGYRALARVASED